MKKDEGFWSKHWEKELNAAYLELAIAKITIEKLQAELLTLKGTPEKTIEQLATELAELKTVLTTIHDPVAAKIKKAFELKNRN